jgi:hypothetical protein
MSRKCQKLSVPGRFTHFYRWHFWRKGGQKGAFLEIPKIGNGTKIQLFGEDRDGDPLKTVPGSGFEKTWKTMKFGSGNERFLMAQIYWKCRTVIDFMVFGHSQKKWKTDAKRDLKKHVFLSKTTAWTFKVRLILWLVTFWCEAKKACFLEVTRIGQKIEEIEERGWKGRYEFQLVVRSGQKWSLNEEKKIETGTWDHTRLEA